ncbi:coniferyl-alcohol dehydrogenase [Actinomycetospora corticicola]|uniref:NAD(P)-dependent dehydrogenase (Short-subunit alcohol dehydrogenase family) n=1 Tax=Actinomycetospora corticicola TaxID=663602 RepID=A0A7Y9J753_9PSEU|nr:coniferyl-alcohol dehydrogenase [Actinomycetospora corticicola]NYD37928.1 NAD(P)-dependent dehydrogenase (short-subunit alcohol dehydrogenase family) [Actinomycetospora corticicola]
MSTVFVVTGTSSGVGRALAQFLSRHGVTVIGLDRREPPDREIAHVRCDLTDPRSIDAAVERLDDRVDALANVAGVPGTSPAETVLAVNFLGMRHLTERLLPRIQRGGSVVNVSSAEGRHWVAHLAELRPLLATTSFEEGLRWCRERRPDRPVYELSKEAVLAYTTASSTLTWPDGIRMNGVAPGPVRTPQLAEVERSMDPRRLARQRNAAGRDAEADEIAAVVAFLMSNESRWINGQTLAADGGVAAATTWAALQTR